MGLKTCTKQLEFLHCCTNAIEKRKIKIGTKTFACIYLSNYLDWSQSKAFLLLNFLAFSFFFVVPNASYSELETKRVKKSIKYWYFLEKGQVKIGFFYKYTQKPKLVHEHQR